MAKITTRQSSTSQDQQIIDDLNQLIDDCKASMSPLLASMLSMSFSPPPTASAQDAINVLSRYVEALLMSNQMMFMDLSVVTHDNLRLNVKLTEALDTIEKFTDVSYDEDLDHATMDLMDCIASTGDANVSANNDLVFGNKATFTKADLKPALREAIVRWVNLRLK